MPAESKRNLEEFGILVIGYNRPAHLSAVLRSLEIQGRLDQVHVWIDGTQARKEHGNANKSSVEVAQKFRVREIRAVSGHLGIEKLMLDALSELSMAYRQLLILEDDCFPLPNGVAQFQAALDEVANRPEVYSVYGHAFGTEPADSRDFTRFQGWGWAAHSAQIRALLPELTRLFLMTETAYLAYIANAMTDEIAQRLNRTPSRNVLSVLAQFYSWDSATSFVTAQRALLHVRTEQPAAVNTGIVEGIGHFFLDTPRLRQPPFNMITVEEAILRYLPPQTLDGTAQ